MRFFAGIAYGMRGIKIPILSQVVIALSTSSSFLASMLVGSAIKKFMPLSFTFGAGLGAGTLGLKVFPMVFLATLAGFSFIILGLYLWGKKIKKERGIFLYLPGAILILLAILRIF
ncbi:MAG: hypothetical protein PWP45_425 [Tepidanaerobacteraceae bacterium]|nr:hypothetical protein [Tepidanaerobacteraceae bacterium]